VGEEARREEVSHLLSSRQLTTLFKKMKSNKYCRNSDAILCKKAIAKIVDRPEWSNGIECQHGSATYAYVTGHVR
jgi:hypothetical protein